MRDYLRVMKAAADGTRVKILKMLQKKNLCVCEVYPDISDCWKMLIWCAAKRTECGPTSVLPSWVNPISILGLY